jgi:hypothetical protein
MLLAKRMGVKQLKTMKLNSKNDGLSARQKIIQKIKKKKSKVQPVGLVMLLVVLLISSCKESSNGQSAEARTNSADSLNKPKVNIQVNRRYDDKGNVIGFDSTYTSYYSNIQGDTSQMDTLMQRFNRYFSTRHNTFLNQEFEPLFFRDSVMYPDFFHDDFFMKRYELNDSYFRNMMHRMDSIKNRFYEEESKKHQPKKNL